MTAVTSSSRQIQELLIAALYTANPLVAGQLRQVVKDYEQKFPRTVDSFPPLLRSIWDGIKAEGSGSIELASGLVEEITAQRVKDLQEKQS